MFKTFETTLAGRKLVVETGKMAQLANGHCVVRYGDTVVMVNVTASRTPREGVDFFPLSVDFEEAVKDAKKGDFIYFDPPYDSDTSIFNSYTEEGFGKNEQVRLARVFKELSDRGCYVMLSNNKTSLISELYKDYNIYVIEANRNINSNGKKRGKVKEVIITNYENNMSFDENEG